MVEMLLSGKNNRRISGLGLPFLMVRTDSEGGICYE
jgi:hypothetical protein